MLSTSSVTWRPMAGFKVCFLHQIDLLTPKEIAEIVLQGYEPQQPHLWIVLISPFPPAFNLRQVRSIHGDRCWNCISSCLFRFRYSIQIAFRDMVPTTLDHYLHLAQRANCKRSLPSFQLSLNELRCIDRRN